MPTIHNIKRDRGVAGQYALTATVEYEGEGRSWVTFVGSTFGGPIVMVTDAGQIFVSRAVLDRIGSHLDEDWVRAFLGEGA